MTNPQAGWNRSDPKDSIMANTFKADILIALVQGELKILKNRWGTSKYLEPHLFLDIFTKGLRTGAMKCNLEKFNLFKEPIEQELREVILKVFNKYEILEKEDESGQI